MSCRNPFVAGRFYPKEKEAIIDFIQNNTNKISNKTRAISFIAPHAAYLFSGKTALKVYEKNIIPSNVILLSPNHTSFGDKISIDNNDAWKTPLGSIKVNKQISEYIIENSNYAKLNNDAQVFEHAIEVQIPFIQYFNIDASIVPITIAENNINILNDFSNTLHKTINKFGIEKCLIICSSDMTHFEKADLAEKQDEEAINQIINLNPLQFYKTVIDNKISTCGLYPLTILLFLLEKINTENKILSKLVEYSNSGQVTNDYSDVVSYASIEFLIK